MISPAAIRSRARHRRHRRMIDVHFAGQARPAGERGMRSHLVTCADCRAHYDRHMRLAAADPDGAVAARERLARGLGLSGAAPRPGVGRARMALAVCAISACAALVLLLPGLRPRLPQPRGAPGPAGSQLLVYAIGKEMRVTPVVSELRADSGLAFAYANVGQKRRLMVFAVDEGKRVYWFHPAWQDAADDPVALDIQPDAAVHELPQVVYHRFQGQRLQLFAVFMDGAMSARQMEAALARAPTDARGRIQLTLRAAEVTSLDLRLVASP